MRRATISIYGSAMNWSLAGCDSARPIARKEPVLMRLLAPYLMLQNPDRRLPRGPRTSSASLPTRLVDATRPTPALKSP